MTITVTFALSFSALPYSRFRLEFFRSVLRSLSWGGTKKRQQNQDITKKKAKNRKMEPKRCWEKKGSVAGRFRPKNWPKTVAKSKGKPGHKRKFFWRTTKGQLEFFLSFAFFGHFFRREYFPVTFALSFFSTSKRTTKRIFPSHFFASSFSALLYSHFRLEFFRPAVQSLPP